MKAIDGIIIVAVLVLLVMMTSCSTCIETTVNGLPGEQTGPGGVVYIEKRSGETVGGLPTAHTDEWLKIADMGAGAE